MIAQIVILFSVCNSYELYQDVSFEEIHNHIFSPQSNPWCSTCGTWLVLCRRRSKQLWISNWPTNWPTNQLLITKFQSWPIPQMGQWFYWWWRWWNLGWKSFDRIYWNQTEQNTGTSVGTRYQFGIRRKMYSRKFWTQSSWLWVLLHLCSSKIHNWKMPYWTSFWQQN